MAHGDYNIVLIYIAENLTDEIQKKIADAFDVFDHESNKTVDVRYVHTFKCTSISHFIAYALSKYIDTITIKEI